MSLNLAWLLCYDSLCCVNTGLDKLIFGDGTSLTIQTSKSESHMILYNWSKEGISIFFECHFFLMFKFEISSTSEGTKYTVFTTIFK